MLGTFRNWVDILDRALAAGGVQLLPALAAEGLGLPADPSARLPVTLTRAIWQQAERLSDDPVLGLAMQWHTDFADFEELGLVSAAGGSLAQVLARCARYHRLVSDALSFEVAAIDGELHVRIGSRHDPHWRTYEFGAALLVRLLRVRFGRDTNPLQVQFPFANPAGQAAYQRYFRCPVQLAVEGPTVLVFAADGARQSVSGSEALAARLERLLEERLALLQQSPSWTERVGNQLQARLAEGEPTLTEVAAALHVSARSLQRHLAAEGMSFQQVLDDTRRLLAQRWLAQGRGSLTQLAFELGFASSSAFSRAYRRWFGVAASRGGVQ